jgi:hypothetical protein
MHPRKAIQNNRHNPRITILNRPSEAKVPDAPDNEGRNHQKETKFRFVDALVSFRHVTRDEIAHGTAGGVSDHPKDPGR